MLFLRGRDMKKPPEESPLAVRLTSRPFGSQVPDFFLGNRKADPGLQFLESRNSASHGYPRFALSKGTFFFIPIFTWLNSPYKKTHHADNRLMGKSPVAFCGRSLFPTSVGCDRP